MIEATPFHSAKQICGRHQDLVEEQLASILRLQSEFIQHAADPKAGSFGRLDQDNRHSVRSLGRTGLRDDEHQTRKDAVGYEGLGTVDDITVGTLFGASSNRLKI